MQTDPTDIVHVQIVLRSGLSYRDVEELIA